MLITPRTEKNAYIHVNRNALELHKSPYSAIHMYMLPSYKFKLHCPFYDDLASRWRGKAELP